VIDSPVLQHGHNLKVIGEYNAIDKYLFVEFTYNNNLYQKFVQTKDAFCSQSQERVENARLKNAALGFLAEYSTNWSTRDKAAAINGLFGKVKTLLGLDSRVRLEIVSGVSYWGNYDHDDRVVRINSGEVNNIDTLNVVLHEARHVYQAESQSGMHYYVSYDTFGFWNPYSTLNNAGSASAPANSTAAQQYWARPVEWDARQFADQDHAGSFIHYSANWY